jgi:hypothetical protein
LPVSQRASRLGLLVAALGVWVAFSGCSLANPFGVGSAPRDAALNPTQADLDSATGDAVQLTGQEYAYPTASAIMIERPGFGEVTRLVAHQPSSVVWANRSELAWVEPLGDDSDLVGYVIVQRPVTGGEIRQLHWSREPMQNLAFADSGEYVAYQQAADLFVVQVQTGRVTRVGEGVTGFAWTPDRAQLLVRTATAATVVELASDGTIAESQEIFAADETEISGLAWRDRLTLVAFRRDPETKAVDLVEYLPQRPDSEPRVLLNWLPASDNADDESVAAEPAPFQALASPNGNLLAVTGPTGLEVYSFATGRRTAIPNADGELHSWQDSQWLRIAKPEKAGTIGGHYQLTVVQPGTNSPSVLADRIPYPSFPPAL